LDVRDDTGISRREVDAGCAAGAEGFDGSELTPVPDEFFDAVLGITVGPEEGACLGGVDGEIPGEEAPG
jgi:hypothetical protein